MPPSTQPPAVIGLVLLDFSGDAEAWSKLGVFTYHGALPRSEGHDDDHGDTLDAPAILKRAEELGFQTSSSGSGVPGRPYADEPWIQVFEKSLIITQRGGRDV
jgi:hypothetical protein